MTTEEQPDVEPQPLTEDDEKAEHGALVDDDE